MRKTNAYLAAGKRYERMAELAGSAKLRDKFLAQARVLRTLAAQRAEWLVYGNSQTGTKGEGGP